MGANWRGGLSNLFDFIGQYAGNYGLMQQKAKASEQSEQDKLMKDLLQYNVWTNPDDPARQAWSARHPGVTLPTMSNKITPEIFIKLMKPGFGGGGGGGGFNIFGGGGGVSEAPPDWDKQ